MSLEPPSNQDRVKVFHLEYNLPINHLLIDKLPINLKKLRDSLLDEEIKEYKDADTTIQRAKEAADILYILYGDALCYGYNLDDVFDLVHQSNMTKNGGTRPDGKVLKGTSYIPPNLKEIGDDR